MQTGDGVLSKYMGLFAGRTDQYAVGAPRQDQPWKFRYSKREAPLTPELFEQHLRGDITIGAYCERDGQARWFALDFDPPKDNDDHPVEGGFDQALKDARAVQRGLLQGGLLTYLERSRSGNGIHLWGFLDDWVDARELARVVDSYVPPGLETWDRAKRYPPLRASENSVLICLPYAGEAVERGNSMFLQVTDPTSDGVVVVEALPLESVFDRIMINPSGVIREVAAKLLKERPLGERVGELGAGSKITTINEWDGRPTKLGTGIVKMLSPFGCGFMRGVWLNRHDPKLVREPEWYAFLGQLSAFKLGREAAHSLFSDHKYYDPVGMNGKYDHATANPPVGCAKIHEDFPQFKCKGCPLTAPYRKGYLTIPELCGESPQELERALYKRDLERIRRLDASDSPEGISLGMPGTDPYLRLRPGDFAAFGAQPSIGKTAAAVHIANTVAPTGVDVCWFSAESGEVSFHNRQIAHRANVDSYAFTGMRIHHGAKLRLSPEEFARVEEATDWLERQPMWENYTTSSPERIYDAVEAMLCKRGKSFTAPALIMFDYFQYAQGGDQFKPGEEHVRLARASFALKSITKIIEHPLLTFAQLIRESEGNDDPQINWWRGTARLEHDIDIGLIMTGERMPGLYAPRALTCVKNREGQVGWKLQMLLEQAVSRFQGSEQASTANTLTAETPWQGEGGQLSMAPPSGE
jgi:hypothetical protein